MAASRSLTARGTWSNSVSSMARNVVRSDQAESHRDGPIRHDDRSVTEPDRRTRQMPTMTKAYAITADAVAAETEANGGDVTAINVSKVVQLDDPELRDLGPRDVRLKILAVSAEHNNDHAAPAAPINIAEARGGQRAAERRVGKAWVSKCRTQGGA